MPDAASATPPGTRRTHAFVRRLFSFIALWTIVLSAMLSGYRWISDPVFLGFMVALAGLGLMEFYGLVEKRGWVCFKTWGILGGLLLMVSTFVYLSGLLGKQLPPAKANDFETSFLIIFVLGLCLRLLFSRGHAGGLLAVATTLFGLMYVPWLLNFIQKINYFPGIGGHGTFYVLYFIAVTKFSDSGAYAVGSLVGKHKMAPHISPGKSWEGGVGAILVSVVASVLFAHVASAKLHGMNLGHAVILGFLLGGGAVVGDLIESLFKREAGVKDSGRFLPGIGGILDLLDSLLFNAPLMYVYLRHILTHP